jgi:excisionase family DNA binding protein
MSDVSQTHFTAEQLATKWGVSLRTVRRLIYAEKLKAVRIGPLVRIPQAEVERYERSLPAA